MNKNNESLINHIKNGVLTNRWKNGEAGQFRDFDNNLLYRFCQTNESLKFYLLTEDEQRKLPILICGFVAWLIKYWGSDSGKIYSSYLDMRIRQYEESQKTAPDILKRNLTQEFFESYIDDEQSWIKQSESVYEFVTDEDVVNIKKYIKHFLEYVDEQKKQTMKNTMLNQADDKKAKSETIPSKRTIDSEKLGHYFIASFKGMGNGKIDYFSTLIAELQTNRTRTEYDKIALMIYKSDKMNKRKPASFNGWRKVFSECVGYEPTTIKPNQLKELDKETQSLFSYL